MTVGRERLFVWLTIRESDPFRGGKQLLVEGGEVPGERAGGGRNGASREEEKKRLPPGTPPLPSYAYLKTDACLYIYLSILLCEALGTYDSQRALDSIRYTTALGTMHASNTSNTECTVLNATRLENSFTWDKILGKVFRIMLNNNAFQEKKMVPDLTIDVNPGSTVYLHLKF